MLAFLIEKILFKLLFPRKKLKVAKFQKSMSYHKVPPMLETKNHHCKAHDLPSQS